MITNEHRKCKDRSEKRACWLFNGILFSCLLLVLGPCSVEQISDDAMFDIKDIERCMKYGDSVDWDGASASVYYRPCSFDLCFY